MSLGLSIGNTRQNDEPEMPKNVRRGSDQPQPEDGKILSDEDFDYKGTDRK